jgi:hypothetical protein
MDDAAPREVYIEGAFDLGPGNFHVDWLMRDRSERVCSAHWDISATLARKDRQLPLPISAGEIRAVETGNRYETKSTGQSSRERVTRVAVIVNVVGIDLGTGHARTAHSDALFGIMRALASESRIVPASVTAIDLLAEKVIYRHDDPQSLSLSELQDALKPATGMTVDIRQLERNGKDGDFLGEIIGSEMSRSRPDGVILISPKLGEGSGVRTSLAASGSTASRVFYMSLEVGQSENPWPDFITAAVRRAQGLAYSIRQPRDLLHAWADLTRRLFDSPHDN